MGPIPGQGAGTGMSGMGGGGMGGVGMGVVGQNQVGGSAQLQQGIPYTNPVMNIGQGMGPQPRRI